MSFLWFLQLEGSVSWGGSGVKYYKCFTFFNANPTYRSLLHLENDDTADELFAKEKQFLNCIVF